MSSTSSSDSVCEEATSGVSGSEESDNEGCSSESESGSYTSSDGSSSTKSSCRSSPSSSSMSVSSSADAGHGVVDKKGQTANMGDLLRPSQHIDRGLPCSWSRCSSHYFVHWL